METDKKVAKRVKRNTNPIETTVVFGEPDAYSEKAYPKEITEIKVNATEQPTPSETSTQPTQQIPERPIFTSEKEESYRQLLLERPNVPCITNIQEAIKFVGDYQRWNNKVKLAFR